MRLRPAQVLPLLLMLLARSASPSQPLGNLPPDQALDAFETEPGFVVESVATEPLVVDPVALAFDEHGRLFVAEDRDYPIGSPDGHPQGVIALLEDRDHDGRMDTRHEFATGIAFPNGLMCWRGGVVVTASPNVFWLADTNGDGRADLKETWLTGFDTNATSQLRANDPTLGPEGWIHFAGGLRGGKIRASDPNGELLDTDKGDPRFHPDRRQLALDTGKSQFGLAFDDAGNRFACMNRVQVQHAPIAARYLARNPLLHSSGTLHNCPEFPENTLMPQYSAGATRYFPISDNVTTADSHIGTYSAACAVHIYRGRQLPADYHGAAFSCDPTGNLVRADRLEKTGGTFAARRIREGTEALRSRDNWFRPVFLADGPDGALYVADMYRKTIEHPEYLPGEVRKHTDFESGKGMGRIWRLRGATPIRGKPELLGGKSSSSLAKALDSPIPWVRDTAFRLILEQRDHRILPSLKRALRRNSDAGPTVARLRLLQCFDALDPALLMDAIRHPEPAVRQNAIALSEARLSSDVKLLHAVLSCADDPDPHVRFQAVLSLGEVQDPRVVPALARVATRQSNDRWTRAAILSCLSDQDTADRFRSELFRAPSSEDGALLLAAELGRLSALRLGGVPAKALPALSSPIKETSYEPSFLIAFLVGFAEIDPSSVRAAVDQASDSSASRLRSAGASAADTGLSVARRKQAIQWLAFDTSAQAAQILKPLLDVSVPIEIQTAAARSLLSNNHASLAAELLSPPAWDRHSPALRQTLIQIVASRADLAGVLLDCLERGSLSPGFLSASQKETLRRLKDPALRSRAERLVAAVPDDRVKAFESTRAALKLDPVPNQGREVFQRACASCHRLNQQGTAVGPDLFGIRQQPKETILYHIVVPEAEIAPNFVNYECDLKDGRSFSGLLAAESAAAFTLRMAQGVEEVVPRNQVAHLSASRLSLMPQELEKTMSLQELADLLAYLRGEQ